MSTKKELYQYNRGSGPEMCPDFIRVMNCYHDACKKEILVNAGSMPDEYGQITPQDILRLGVCIAHRRLKNRDFHWMNVCPYCDRSQSIFGVKKATSFWKNE